MSKPQNPERLFAFTYTSAVTRARATVADNLRARMHLARVRESKDYGSSCAPIVEYIRLDKATEQTAAAVRGEAHEVERLRGAIEQIKHNIRLCVAGCTNPADVSAFEHALDIIDDALPLSPGPHTTP